MEEKRDDPILNIGDSVYDGTSGGVIVAISENDMLVEIRFCADKDYSTLCWNEELPYQRVQHWRSVLLESLQETENRYKKQANGSTIKVVHEGDNVMHCGSCHIWYTYEDRDLTTSYTGVRIAHCRVCGKAMKSGRF